MALDQFFMGVVPFFRYSSRHVPGRDKTYQKWADESLPLRGFLVFSF